MWAIKWSFDISHLKRQTFDIFKNFTFWPWFYATDLKTPTISEVLTELLKLCLKNLPQSWTKLVETKAEKQVNSKNGLSFQIPKYVPYFSISMLKVFFQNLTTLWATLIWEERGIFCCKMDFLFCPNSFV